MQPGDSRSQPSTTHLLWIPAAALVGGGASSIFGDLLTLPVDVYYAVYAAVVLAFLGGYIRLTGLDVRPWLGRRLPIALALGVVGGLVLMRGALGRPPEGTLAGGELLGALLVRGVMYGAVDGLLLFAFPWLVVWRALGAEGRSRSFRAGASVLALAAMLLVTTTYHMGYRDFRSSRIVLPNVGAVISGTPTLLSANPVAAPLAHVVLHVTAVLHSPASDLYLPPHRDEGR